ncbi:predicted protein, partial [Nematostella vectensis]
DELLKLFQVGDRVLVNNTKPGVIAFLGETKFAKGDWAGIILDDPTGKNDGSVAGEKYFECKPLHGVFTKLEKITKVNQVTESPGSPVENSSSLEIGDRVVVSGNKIGTLRYVGTTEFAKGEWAGVELDEPLGKNDGAVAGTRYFQCIQGYGLFAPVHKVIKTGKKETTKLLTSPPKGEPTLPISQQLIQETVQNSLAAAATNGGSESSLSSTASAPLSTTSSLQGLTSKEALQDREKQIQTLLEERDFERTEVANATSQVAKAEEEVSIIKRQHEQAAMEYSKNMQALKELIELAEKEKAELHCQVEEERRKTEDLQFKLAEEEIILGDELKVRVGIRDE